MLRFSRFDRHVRLMTGLADALGIDLGAEVAAGRLTPEAYRERIFRCVGCDKSDACERFLADAGGFATEAPEFCRNKSEFDAWHG